MDLGYQFDILPLKNHPGIQGLDVVIHAQPTQKHFDPEKIRVSIATEKKLIATAIISLPWHANDKYQYVAGLIKIADRYQKSIDIFSFGGDLIISESPSQVVVHFSTSVPMFDKLITDSLCELLASQFEGLIASRKGAWASDPEQFEKRLVSLKPEYLYWLCVDELLLRYKNQKELTPRLETLLQFLNEEHHRLQLRSQSPPIRGSITDYL